uniref:tRNA 5-methylaminomethyl-2-thiouridine synthase TusB n=1 Tax=uncultured Thiotrichaceae bacterium TaxID=298394 RepID=A0A6S6UIX0_9GAMM|nr:MAG: tRNA 5-methylaminomethyl-2-thiouridine synthase TusB [uncultured Thiotrichaceae bacterium]
MSMLHIVNKSPFERNALASCLGHALEGDAVLLIEDAVVGAIDGSNFSEQLKAALADKSVYVLGADLAARGMQESRVVEGIQVVDYAGFVDLAANNEKTQSWL